MSLSPVKEQTGVRITRLTDTGDPRGWSFQIPAQCLEFLGDVRDLHLATVKPGAIRGNHYHKVRKEVLFLFHTDQWSVHWDCGPGTQPQTQMLTGSGVVMLEIELHASHALRNDGASDMQMIGMSNAAYNPQEPDSFPRKVV
jgi:dTDP-4-dehydrorhamnose 3,5-epimerase-like enzyme